MRNRKTFQRIIGMVIGVTTGFVAFIFVNKMLYTEPLTEKNYDEIKKMVNNMNSIAPKMIDNYICFDSITTNYTNTLSYYYSVNNVDKNSTNAKEFESKLKPILIDNIKNKNSLELVRSEKMIVVYHYRDKNGAMFSNIKITPDMYK